MSAESRPLTADSSLPPVTCLCPTYGRFSRLREALACFLAQDYPSRRLLILNDAPEPIRLTADSSPPASHFPPVAVSNEAAAFANLGLKRQALLEAAWTPLVAHWDDDDLYLPHHLSRSVRALLARGAGCVKSRGAWYILGDRVRGIHHNVFEGSMVFRRREALEFGGYPPKHSGQAKALMQRFDAVGGLYKIPDTEGAPSYVYHWGQGIGHISAYKNRPESLRRFTEANTDFGDGSPLTPGDLRPYWDAIDDWIELHLVAEAKA